MKAITLHTAAPDNGGARRDAGETVTVGEAADEITLELAEALVAASSAVEASLSPNAPLLEAQAAPRKAKTVPDAASEEAE